MIWGGEIALLYCPLPGTGMIGSAHGRNWWFGWTSSSLGNLLFESFLSSELLKTLKVYLARHSTDLRKGRPSTLDPSRHLKTPGTLWVTLCWPWFAPGPFLLGVSSLHGWLLARVQTGNHCFWIDWRSNICQSAGCPQKRSVHKIYS